MLALWDSLAIENGLKGIYVVSGKTTAVTDYRSDLFDAYYRFEPAYTLKHKYGKKIKYVLFVDSDDFLNIYAVERWLMIADQTKSDIVVATFCEYYGGKYQNMLFEKTHNEEIEIMNSKEILSYMFLKNERLSVPWGKLYRRSLFKTIRFQEGITFGEDMLVAHILFAKANIIVLDHFSSYYYSQEGVSAVRSSYNEKKLMRIVAAKRWLDFTKDNYPEIYKDAFYRYIIIIINECSLICSWDDKRAKYVFYHIAEELKSRKKIIKEQNILSINDKIKSFFIIHKMFYFYRIVRKIIEKIK